MRIDDEIAGRLRSAEYSRSADRLNRPLYFPHGAGPSWDFACLLFLNGKH